MNVNLLTPGGGDGPRLPELLQVLAMAVLSGGPRRVPGHLARWRTKRPHFLLSHDRAPGTCR